LALKPLVFRFLLRHQSEHNTLAWNIGFRLGQISEFSLLIAFCSNQCFTHFRKSINPDPSDGNYYLPCLELHRYF